METKEYSENKDITVLWPPSRCKHAGVCVKTLPKVYHPKDKPWITPTEATADELKQQIERCPTGALGYRLNH
ncbi:(4Fe-4S)-binding protein [Elizabethkingia miricola]|uniref:(4Fe-4S)-binding protein n=1 Tax=Elizabethkingia miricola TaxID=172045 RepID=UPI003891F05C